MEKNLDSSKLIKILLEGLWIFFIASLLHFGYSATGFFPLSFICAVNESTWEHIKIIFFSALFYDFFLYIRYYKGNCCLLTGLAPALFSILISVPLLFYGYTWLIGTHLFLLDLLVAYLSAFICQFIINKIAFSGRDCCRYQTFALLFTMVMIFTFFMFTWYPLKLPLFLPPE